MVFRFNEPLVSKRLAKDAAYLGRPSDGSGLHQGLPHAPGDPEPLPLCGRGIDVARPMVYCMPKDLGYLVRSVEDGERRSGDEVPRVARQPRVRPYG